MTKPNKFTELKEAIKGRQVEGEPEEPSKAPQKPAAATNDSGQGNAQVAPPKRPRGRPKGGKRNNPNFQQVTLYMPSTVYAAVQRELQIRRRTSGHQGPRDMSELVGELVREWHRDNLGPQV